MIFWGGFNFTLCAPPLCVSEPAAAVQIRQSGFSQNGWEFQFTSEVMEEEIQTHPVPAVLRILGTEPHSPVFSESGRAFHSDGKARMLNEVSSSAFRFS